MRTTSLVEAMNSVIQRSFPAKTHMFKFAESLRLHEAMKSTDLYQISSGHITNSKLQQIRAADKQRNDRINLLSEMLKSEQISTEEFLDQIGEKYIAPSTVGTYFLFFIHKYIAVNHKMITLACILL